MAGGIISQISEQIKQIGDLNLTNEEIVQLEEMMEVLSYIIATQRTKTENPDDPLVYY